MQHGLMSKVIHEGKMYLYNINVSINVIGSS